MNDRIKEKLALYRLILSFSLLALFGIVGWVYREYEKYGINETRIGILILIIFAIFSGLWYIKILKTINKI